MSNKKSGRSLPNALAEKHKKQREQTRETVQQAILSLKEEGRTVTTKNLVEITGLSRATFSKPHVDEILRMNKVCKYKEAGGVITKADKTPHELRLEIQFLENKIERLIKKNEELLNEKNSMKLKYLEQKDRNEKLLGEIQAISTKCSMNNIRLEMVEIDNNKQLRIIK